MASEAESADWGHSVPFSSQVLVDLWVQASISTPRNLIFSIKHRHFWEPGRKRTHLSSLNNASATGFPGLWSGGRRKQLKRQPFFQTFPCVLQVFFSSTSFLWVFLLWIPKIVPQRLAKKHVRLYRIVSEFQVSRRQLSFKSRRRKAVLYRNIKHINK